MAQKCAVKLRTWWCGGEKTGTRPMGATVMVGVVLVCCVGLTVAGCSDKVDEAMALEEIGDWQGALTLYEEVLAEEPDNLPALAGAAVALTIMQRHDEALAYQERLIAMDPGDVQTRVELGFNYLNHQDRAEDAVTVLAEAAALEPSAQHLSFLAQAQEEVGDDEAAEGSLRKAIATEPQYVYAYRLLIGLLEAQGRADEAVRLYDEAERAGVDLSESE